MEDLKFCGRERSVLMSSKRPLILASSSPRRVELLKLLGGGFKQVQPDIEEARKKNESPAEYALRNARQKAEAVLTKFPNGLVIAADTIVVLGDKVLEK